jgi:asparagine synthase (glutamine-hydrolysing)
MRLNPADKMAGNGRMEKWLLRKAFEDYLPQEIVWRQKEQFSDGVGYRWIDTLRELASQKVTDAMMTTARYRFPVNTPLSKEEYYYRSIFAEHFPSETAAMTVPSVPSVACSTAEALAWDEAFRNQNEPSGRSIKNVHLQSY